MRTRNCTKVTFFDKENNTVITIDKVWNIQMVHLGSANGPISEYVITTEGNNLGWNAQHFPFSRWNLVKIENYEIED